MRISRSSFPDFADLSDFSEGVNVMPNSTVEHVSFHDDQVHLRLNHGKEVRCHCSVAFLLKNIYSKETRLKTRICGDDLIKMSHSS